ncbi:hypothetical protein CQA49_04555, partial [Helicobacter sp. MIT 00-7814]|uniref:hypothetical protein n=1 Tax=unclassified Helicobacter TaxID=2593540 RepID=UPI000E3962F9
MKTAKLKRNLHHISLRRFCEVSCNCFLASCLIAPSGLQAGFTNVFRNTNCDAGHDANNCTISGAVTVTSNLGSVPNQGGSGNTTTMTIAQSGSFSGSNILFRNIDTATRFVLNNNGSFSITGNGQLVYESGGGDITNNGTFTSRVQYSTSTGASQNGNITNNGTFTGNVAYLNSSSGSVTNNSDFTGSVSFASGQGNVENSGTFTGNVSYGAGGGTLTNSNVINGLVSTSGGTVTITNDANGIITGGAFTSGGVRGNAGVYGGSGTLNLTNNGSITTTTHGVNDVGIWTANGVVGTITNNAGGLIEGITFSRAANTITNAGQIANG